MLQRIEMPIPGKRSRQSISIFGAYESPDPELQSKASEYVVIFFSLGRGFPYGVKMKFSPSLLTTMIPATPWKKLMKFVFN